MSYSVSSLADLPFGALLTGFDTGMLDDPEVARQLYDLWIDRGLVVFREVPGGEPEHIRLSKVFGPLEAHPLKDRSNDPNPELADISYDPDEGDLYELSGGLRRGAWLPWHFDLVYVERINHGGILRPLKLPSQGGETGFIDQIAAYQRLPAGLRARIEGLDVVYRFDIDASHMRFGKPDGLRMLRAHPRGLSSMARIDQYPPVAHPLVYEQPETGRKVLNFSPWFALGVEGLPAQDSDALLSEVAHHCLDDRGAYLHRWQMGDMVLWDNWRMMHCALGISPDDQRHMQRTTIAGDYGGGRLAFGVRRAERDCDIIQV